MRSERRCGNPEPGNGHRAGSGNDIGYAYGYQNVSMAISRMPLVEIYGHDEIRAILAEAR